MARNKRASSKATQTQAADDAIIAAVVEGFVDVTETSEDIDPAILAALAGEEPEAVEQEVEQPEQVEEIDPAVAPEADVEAVLAAIAASEPAEDPAAKSKSGRKKKEASTTAAVTVPARQFTDVSGMTEKEVEAALGGISAKKVLEKAKNLIEAIERGRKLSNFTKLAVTTLMSEGEISGADLVKRYEAAGLSLGTARAQSQQMTALFKALGIAQPDATNQKALVIANKPLVDEMFKLAA